MISPYRPPIGIRALRLFIEISARAGRAGRSCSREYQARNRVARSVSPQRSRPNHGVAGGLVRGGDLGEQFQGLGPEPSAACRRRVPNRLARCSVMITSDTGSRRPSPPRRRPPPGTAGRRRAIRKSGCRRCRARGPACPRACTRTARPWRAGSPARRSPRSRRPVVPRSSSAASGDSSMRCTRPSKYAETVTVPGGLVDGERRHLAGPSSVSAGAEGG